MGKGKKKTKVRVPYPVYHSYWIKNTTIGATTYIWRSDKTAEKGRLCRLTLLSRDQNPLKGMEAVK